MDAHMELTPSPVHMRSPEGVPNTCRRHKWMTLYLDSSSSLQSLPLCIRLSSRYSVFPESFLPPSVLPSHHLLLCSFIYPLACQFRHTATKNNAKKNNENIKTNGNQKNSKNFSK